MLMADPVLLDESAPPVELVVSAWLHPWKRGTQRIAGDPLPYRLIHAVAGSDSVSGVSTSTVSIHTLATSPYEALLEAHRTHRRMMLLSWNPLTEIEIHTDQVVCVDFCNTVMLPTEVDYQDPNVTRYVARYDIGLSHTASV